jgi:MFS family permease
LGLLIAIAVFLAGINIVYEFYKDNPGIREQGYIMSGLAAGFLGGYIVYRSYVKPGGRRRLTSLAVMALTTSTILTLMLAVFKSNTEGIGIDESLAGSWETGLAVFLAVIWVEYFLGVVKFSIAYFVVFFLAAAITSALRVSVSNGTYFYVFSGFASGLLGGLAGLSHVRRWAGQVATWILMVFASLYLNQWTIEQYREYCSECAPYLSTWRIALIVSSLIGLSIAILVVSAAGGRKAARGNA